MKTTTAAAIFVSAILVNRPNVTTECVATQTEIVVATDASGRVFGGSPIVYARPSYFMEKIVTRTMTVSALMDVCSVPVVCMAMMKVVVTTVTVQMGDVMEISLVGDVTPEKRMASPVMKTMTVKVERVRGGPGGPVVNKVLMSLAEVPVIV